MEQQLWFTAVLNQLLAKPVTALLGAMGIHPEFPTHPIPNYLAMEILVIIIIMVLLGLVAARLSVDRPGKLQQGLEVWIEGAPDFDFGLAPFADEIIGHGSRQFMPLLFTLAIFILLSNILGEIPYLGTPTQAIYVTVGCALVSLVYYHFYGIRHHGVLGYLRTFMGPVLVIGPLMFVIEIVSHLARGLSLSVRLFANMLAGERITEIFFEKLFGLVLPLLPMLLHIFVGVLQAYIFVLLTMIYLSGAVSEEH